MREQRESPTFTLEATALGSRARAGRLRTLHDEVLTPVFMPVGTHAVVRAQRREDLLAAGAKILLANTYHLMLRPGTELFERMGGIHRFMSWPHSVLTDSGGYQIFSLPGSRSMSEEGAVFTSYVDRQLVRLSPESSIAAQRVIGSDIMMALDQCVPSSVDSHTARQAMELTHRWARRSLAARGDSPQALFGIVQGASHAELRAESACVIADMPFDGFAIGGLAVGEAAHEREDCTAVVTERLPEQRPRYLMGVGTTRDLLEAVHRGVDMFDCILPTALAKQGVAFTSRGRRDLRRAAYRNIDAALDPVCECHTCRTHSIAYLFHLTKIKDPQGWQLLGLHNLHFYLDLMRTMRRHIVQGSWLEFYASQREILDARDAYGPPVRHITRAQRRQQRLSLGRYEVTSVGGVGRIRDTASGEVMHPGVDPFDEARLLYVVQSRLPVRLAVPDRTPLVVWDVGLGAAANAMAVIEAAEAASGRELELVSFENDLDALRLALRHPAFFKHLNHPGPRQLLERGEWRSKAAPVRWRLRAGDFERCKFEEPPPDLIYYDPFSFKADVRLWSVSAFRELAAVCDGRATELYTYSAATRVRAALLVAGFHVAAGCATGAKAETTIALSPAAAAAPHEHPMLDRGWLTKWRRSDARTPVGAAEHPWDEALVTHPQFARDVRIAP